MLSITPLESNAPFWLLRGLMNQQNIVAFAETGTLGGHTALLATEMFPRVHTVEVSPIVYEKNALPEVKSHPRITRHLGDSVEVMPRIIQQVQGAICWWLDGHWSGFGRKYTTECPLLGELAILRDRPHDVVLVDDARMFHHPPGPPHDPTQWPVIEQVVEALRGRVDRHVTQIGDVLFGTPEPLIRTF